MKINKNVTVGSTTLIFIGLSGKDGDLHRPERFAVPGGDVITGRGNAESAAKRMEFKASKV